MSTDQQHCTFYLDGLYLGVPVEAVQEVLRYQPMTEVPLTTTLIRGLINLRGQIVTAVEMRHLLHLAPRPAESEPMNVILRDDHGAISLLVDEIGDVVEVDPGGFEAAPPTVPDTVRPFVRGVFKLDGQLLLALDTERLTHSLSAAAVAA